MSAKTFELVRPAALEGSNLTRLLEISTEMKEKSNEATKYLSRRIEHLQIFKSTTKLPSKRSILAFKNKWHNKC